MELLDQTIALWVVGCGLHVLDTKIRTQCSPQGGGELGTPIRCHGSWHAKPGNPASEQCTCTGGCRRGLKGNGLSPPGGSVYYCEQVGESLRGRQGADQVHVWLKRLEGTGMCWGRT